VEIKITPKNNYVFYPGLAFSYPDDAVAILDDNRGASTRLVTVVYKPVADKSGVPAKITHTYISGYGLDAYVPIPVAGELPVFQVNSREDLEAELRWTKNPGGQEITGDDTFEAGTVYKAEIKITPKNNYVFYPGLAFSYPEDTVTDLTDDQEAPTRLVTVIYKPTKVSSKITVTF
jgi:hypothetical protein